MIIENDKSLNINIVDSIEKLYDKDNKEYISNSPSKSPLLKEIITKKHIGIGNVKQSNLKNIDEGIY